jgi:hypothetical protein
MTRDTVTIRELREVTTFQAEVLRQYGQFMLWLDKEIEEYEGNIQRHNRDNGNERPWEKSKMVTKIENKAWDVRLKVTRLIRAEEKDPAQKSINP